MRTAGRQPPASLFHRRKAPGTIWSRLFLMLILYCKPLLDWVPFLVVDTKEVLPIPKKQLNWLSFNFQDHLGLLGVGEDGDRISRSLLGTPQLRHSSPSRGHLGTGLVSTLLSRVGSNSPLSMSLLLVIHTLVFLSSATCLLLNTLQAVFISLEWLVSGPMANLLRS